MYIEQEELDRREELWEQGYWEVPEGLDTTDFNFNWRPDRYDRPYIHVFGTQWQRSGGPRFIVPNNEGYKFQPNQIAKKLPDMKNWVTNKKYTIEFDYSWHPDEFEPPYIWTFGNQYVNAYEMPTVEYIVEGAKERKYITDIIATLVSKEEDWKILHNVRVNKDMLKWYPHPYEPPYIYVWGNQYLTAEEMPTVEYHQPTATERKYVHNYEFKLIGDSNNWVIHEDIEDFQIDPLWTPHPHDPPYIYVWGNKWVSGNIKPTVEYRIPNAVDYKFMGDDIQLKPAKKWKQLLPIDTASFDLSWRPNPTEPPYIYTWGHKYAPVEIEPALEYHVDGATERKYMNDQVVKLLPDMEKWKVLLPINADKFDLSWRPDPREPAYVYVWGHKFCDPSIEPVLEYHVEGATERKYMSEIVELLPDMTNWQLLLPINADKFDFSWRPDPTSPPYIYVWGHKYCDVTIEPALEYHVEGATERKYMSEIVELLSDMTNWKVLIAGADFNYDWRPDPREPAFIYVWGNKWNDAATEPTVEYHVEGATERKYMYDSVAHLPQDISNWTVHNDEDRQTFDFSWRPNPHSPPQIYQWSDGGPTYTVQGGTEIVYIVRDETHTLKKTPQYYIQTTLEDLIAEHLHEEFWALNPDIDYSNFDFNWKPNSENFRHINVFGNEQSKNTQTYYVNGVMYERGYREYNYIESNSKLDTKLDIFFIDKSNATSKENLQHLQTRYPTIQTTRYLSNWIDTISRCVKKAKTKFAWIVSSELDYTNFQFDFYPAPWQETMIHVFGTQWSHWGNTYLINTELWESQIGNIKIIEHLKNINHVRSRTATITENVYDTLLIKFLGTDNIPAKYTINYSGSYLNTIDAWLEQNPTIKDKKNYSVWVCTDIVDYNKFDFTYQCDPFQREQIHVFASELHGMKQKFGDTFLLNVSEYVLHRKTFEKIEDYPQKVNYITHLYSTRLQHPIVEHTDDTHVQKVLETDFNNFPYIEFKNNESVDDITMIPSLWDESHRTIIVSNNSSTNIIVPSVAKPMIKKELYDYPYVEKIVKVVHGNALDIVFISNGEPNAEEHWEHLNKVIKENRNAKNRLVRVDGVNGRVAAYHAAANASQTSWFFAVFAKLRVNPTFDWNWQPDRLQQPKHYIFTAINPINRLNYGHQAMIAYNKRITLANAGIGLDFTLDNEHEVVNINSGIAVYNTDPWTTWRTAFREAVKLQDLVSKGTDTNAVKRLARWCGTGIGDHAEWSQRGANDGVAYYNEVSGDFNQLKLSYEWSWLKNRFESIQNLSK